MSKFTKDDIKKEIEGMNSYIPVSKIEKALGMPPTTLQKVLSGKRSLPKKWERVLEGYFVGKPNLHIAPVNLEIKKPQIKEAPLQIRADGNDSADTKKPFMSDAIKKKLGIQ